MKKKGNISLLVLFILVACSLLGIIAVQYIKHMAIQTSQIEYYYKTYYLAKGANEIGLSILQHRGPGFSREITKEDPFITQNLSSGNAFSLSIQGSSSYISQNHPKDENCTKPITIDAGKSYIFPLFTDSKGTTINDFFSENTFYQNKSDFLSQITITGESIPRHVNAGIIASSGGTLSELGIFFTSEIFEGKDFFEKLSTKINNRFQELEDPEIMDRKQNPNLQNYLIIANKDTQPLKFCLLSPNTPLSLPKTYITSFGYAGTKKIGLESIYQQPIPSYLIDSNIVE